MPGRTILIVEDHDPDYEALKIAFQEVGISQQTFRCSTGDEALSYLSGFAGGNASSDPPILILLDLNLPGLDGREVLRRIKSDPVLQPIPVVVFSTSNDERDVQTCYRYGASGFIQKPSDFDFFLDIFRALKQYWLNVVELPHVGGGAPRAINRA